MADQAARRFEVVVEEGTSHGGLYELEQLTYYHVVDRLSNRVVMTFERLMEASLSTDTGLWDDYRFSGVCEVSIAADDRSAIVRFCDGREEIVPLPLEAGSRFCLPDGQSLPGN